MVDYSQPLKSCLTFIDKKNHIDPLQIFHLSVDEIYLHGFAVIKYSTLITNTHESQKCATVVCFTLL